MAFSRLWNNMGNVDLMFSDQQIAAPAFFISRLLKYLWSFSNITWNIIITYCMIAHNPACPWVTFCSPAQSLLTCTLAHACSCLHTWHLPALTPVSLIHSSPYHDVCLSPYLIMFPIHTAFPLVVIAAALPYSYRLLPLLLMASVAVDGSWLHHISHLLDEALGIMTHVRDQKCSQEGGTQLWSATWDDLMVFLHVIHVWSVWSSQLTKHE